ncbi:MAG: hypothetical protein Q8L26_04410 [Candidatus Omnitrophota bacterium]|nr:hypothetical protein [Candidatus Omnitrophota bacterium]
MKKPNRSILVLVAMMGFFAFILPKSLSAEGKFKERIQRRISSQSAIQYEPYYLEQQEISSGEFEQGGKNLPKEEALIEARRFNKPDSSITPSISSYAIYKTDYKAEIEDNVATVKGSVLFEVFKKGWTQLSLVSSSVGLIDVSVNKGASFVTMQGGKYYLMVDKPGRYNLEIEFLIKAARERENGPGSFSFEMMPAPISQFEFTMPESGVDIFVEPAIKTEVKRETNKTIAWAIMPNTNNLMVRWTKALPKEDITPVKLEPKLYADTTTYASVGEGLIRCTTNINYSILQSEVSSLRVALPEDVSVLDVRGNDLRDWKISKKDTQQYVDIYLNFGVKGNYALTLSYERNIGEGSVVADVPQVKALGTERETGYFGIAAATNVELAVNKIDRVNLIDIKELPSSIWGSTTSPILLAFKYLNHPFAIAIDVTKHEELPVLVAAIDSASYITLETDEGKSLTKAIYQVRNNVKQFVHLILPPEATLWSVFVAGKPKKPAKDKNGDILIPLEKSQLAGQTLTQFPVEIVYLSSSSKLGLVGGLKLRLPQTDIPISSLDWRAYLPLDYVYFNFGGDVKLSERGRGRPFIAAMAGAGSSLRQSADSIGEQFAPMVKQDFYQEVKSAQMKGVLPIKIDVPEEGRMYHFSKLLVTEKESPWVSVNFIKVSRKIQGFFKFLIFVLILILGAIFIKKLPKHKKAQDIS